MKTAHTVYASALLLLSFLTLPFTTTGQSEDSPAIRVVSIEKVAPQEDEDAFAPMDDMHRFMDFITKPAYRSLKEILDEGELGRSAFRKVQRHAMLLGETTNLVAERGPEDEEKNKEWRASSMDTFKGAKALYDAAGAKNEDEVRKQWGLMIDGCNRCHTTFDENDHQMDK